MKKYFLLILSLFFGYGSFAQVDTEPLSSINYQNLERLEILSGSLKNDIHLTMKPLMRRKMTDYALYIDTATTFLLTDQDQYNIRHIFRDNNDLVPEEYFEESDSPILKHFYKRPAYLFDAHTDDFTIQVNPIVYANYSYDNENLDGYGYINTRGGSIRATIDDKVSLYTSLTENQVIYPEFVHAYADSLSVVPGRGFHNRNGREFDYFEPKAGISADVTKHINATLGYDKQFIGDGYRSLFLSENSNNSAFLRFNTQFWKIKYTNIYQELAKDDTDGPDTLIGKKYSVTHHLSFDATDWLNIGVFESIVFDRQDQFEFHYLNPVIFYRAIEQQLGSADNVLVGVNYSALIKNRVKLYGQFVLDEFRIDDLREGQVWTNKSGWQQGVKYINAFDVNQLDLQVEVNRVRPYTYLHNNFITGYTGYGQALAHPLGASFTEAIAMARYQPINRLNLNGMVTYAKYGRDPDSQSWGSDVANKTDRDRPFNTGVETGQGWDNTSLNVQGRASFELKHNLNLDLQGVYKRLEAEGANPDFDNIHIGGGIRWNFGAYDYNF